MQAVRKVFRILLGSALILHGLGNTVLPLRGADVAAPGVDLPVVTALYVMAVVGFVAAGLGVFGLSPFAHRAGTIATVAALGSIAAQFWLAAVDLPMGILLSGLPCLAAARWTAWERGWQPSGAAAEPTCRSWRCLPVACAWAFFGWVLATTLTWPWHRAWGTEPHDWTMTLPGDPTPRTPHLEILHAVRIDAPPERVWPWLAQLGQDRAGFYSYDWLERAFLVDIRNSDRIRPEWQVREVGELLPATQPGYAWGLFGERPGWIVDRFEPNRALVLRYWGSFALVPDDHGGTRLLVRSTMSNDRIPAWAAALNFTCFQLPHFIMQRRMLLTIKAHAERA